MRQLSWVCIAVLTVPLAVQQARAQSTLASSPNSIPLIGPIDAGDVLDIAVFGGNGPGSVVHKRVRVAADGTVSLYWMGDPVKLVGLDTPAAAKTIRKANVDALFEDIDWIDVERINSAARSGIAPGPLSSRKSRTRRTRSRSSHFRTDLAFPNFGKRFHCAVRNELELHGRMPSGLTR